MFKSSGTTAATKPSGGFGSAQNTKITPISPLTSPQTTSAKEQKASVTATPASTADTSASSLDYQAEYASAKEAYREYKKYEKAFENEYGHREDPESAYGYHDAYAKLQRLKQNSMEQIDYLLDNYDSFEINGIAFSTDNVSAAMKERLQEKKQELIDSMWAYYNNDPENASPKRIAEYIWEISLLRNTIAAIPDEENPQNQESTNTPEQPQREPGIGVLERIGQAGLAAGAEIAGSYTQVIATGSQWLAEQNITSDAGNIESLKIDLEQAIRERDAYLNAGIPADNPLVIQLNEVIHGYEAQLEYIQSGQREKDNQARRQEMYDTASGLYEQGESARNRATDGLGTVGTFLVNAGIEGGKILADAAVGAAATAIGAPGVALANRLVRSFGDGAYKAAEMGGGSNMQIAYGVTNSMVEYLSNKFELDNGVYDDVIKKFTRGAAKDLKQNMALHEIVSSYALSSLGESLVTLGKGTIDPVYEYMITGECDMDTIWQIWDDGLETFVLSYATNVVTHK